MTQENNNVETQHEKIKQGGQIEQFADAMALFCKVEGWKKLNDNEGNPFKTLRHYIEAEPPYGAGYPGKDGMEKIEAYLSLSPVIKDYFQHCHANCLFEMAKEEGASPNVIAKREFNDVKGASLARAIQQNPEEIYLEKAAAYVEGKERVKPKPRTVRAAAAIRVSATTDQPYTLAKKLKDSFKADFIHSLLKAMNDDNLDDMVELEKIFNLAVAAFNQSKQSEGWSSNNIKAPDSLKDRTPLMEESSLIGDDKDDSKVISLKDEQGKIVIVRFRGLGVSKLSFADEK